MIHHITCKLLEKHPFCQSLKLLQSTNMCHINIVQPVLTTFVDIFKHTGMISFHAMHGSYARLLFTQLSALSHLFIDILTHNPQQIVKIQGPCHFVNQSESSIAKGSDDKLKYK